MALEADFYRYRRHWLSLKKFYQQKKVRVYTELVLSLFLISIFLVFAIRPTVITITGLIREIKDKKLIVEKLEEKIKNLNLAQSNYNVVQNDLYLLDQALPKEADLSSLVKHLEVLAVKSNVSLKNLQFSKVNLRGGDNLGSPEEININLSVNGEYQNLKSFFQGLYSLRRIVLIEDFSFKSSTKEIETGPTLTLTLKGKAFCFRGIK